MLYVFVLEYLLCDFLFYMHFKKFSLLKGRDKDGFPVYQEKLIRESIRKFPYCEATLLQQLVRSIAPVEIVSSVNSDLFLSRKSFFSNLHTKSR